jgi:hypothetical protein
MHSEKIPMVIHNADAIRGYDRRGRRSGRLFCRTACFYFAPGDVDYCGWLSHSLKTWEGFGDEICVEAPE